MSATENRIVKMIFDNAQFKRAASETSGQLSALDKQVASAGKGKGLLDMAGHMDTVRVKASAMQVATVTAIANIANRAVNAGISMAKSLSLDPIKQGFDEYELKMKSIQTILANTKGENLKSVSGALNELNLYADKTIYNFANMTQNIGKLTTAGIGLDDATATVKGFSNMVALAGGDATAAAGAMEQFGQGLQAGAIKAIDWMSISNRGLGSQSLQKAFFETARAAGQLSDVPLSTTFEQWSKDQGGFKNSLESGWLTTETATETLKIMTGDIKNAQELVAMGFDPKTANDMLKIANNALDSATKVRTFSAFMDTTKEALASGWGQVMEVIFGDFNESTKTFTALSESVGGAIDRMFGGIMDLVEGFDKFGGRMNVIATFRNVLRPITSLLGLIGAAWSKVFGDGEAGKGLANLTEILYQLTRPLRILGNVMNGQLTPMEGFRRLIKVITDNLQTLMDWVSRVVEPLTDLLELKVPGSSGIVNWIKDVARQVRAAIDEVAELVKMGSSMGDIFGGLSFDMPSMPSMPSLPSLKSIGGGGEDASGPIAGLASGMDRLKGSISGVNTETKRGMMFNPDADITGGRVRDLDGLGDSLDSTKAKMETVGEKAMPFLSMLKEKLTGFISGFSLDDLMASFNLAVLSTMAISISRFLNTLSGAFSGFVGTGAAINDVLGKAGDALGSFQTAARAKLITAIAIAIGVLAASLWVLSTIPAEKMKTALAGMAGIMLIMVVGVESITKAVEKMEGKGTGLKLTGLSLALMALGAAILMLSGAFLILNYVDWTSMLKGLATIIVVMKLMEAMGKVGQYGAKNLMGTAVALGSLAVSFVILAGALLLFQLVKWEAMAKAGATLAALTLAIGLLALIPYDGIAKVGLAMLSTSVGMLAIANALIIFSLVKWESIGKASVILAVLTASLAALMYVGGGGIGAAGILAMGAALVMIAVAGQMLNGVNWSTIGKVALIMGVLIVAFGGFLAVISFFSPALILLSMFAGQLALLSLALAGLALAFAVVFPLLAAGAGVFAAFATGAAIAFAVFVQTLALQAPIIKNSFLKILQTLIDGLVEAVPMVIDGVRRLFAAIKDQFSSSGGEGAKTAGLMKTSSKSWIEKLKDGIAERIPMIVDKAKDLILKFIDGLVKHSKTIGAKGAELVTGLISGIASRIDRIVSAATDLIIQFATGIQSGLGRIIEAGVQLIADFLHRLAATIRSGSAAIGGGIDAVVDAMKDVGMDMVRGIIGGIDAMFGDAMGAIGDLASGMVNKAKNILDIFSPSRVFMSIGKFLVEGLTKGIQNNAASAITATAAMVSGSIAIASQYMDKFVQDLDQKAIAATARATGLQAAAEKAAKAAERTKKNKKDDKAARRLQNTADKATLAAEKREAAAAKAQEASERAAQFEDSTLIERAQMRADDAQSQIDDAKAAEFEAASKLEQAKALREQASKKGVNKKDAKAFRKQAENLEAAARKDAERADALLLAARNSATAAMGLQQAAAAEAAADFQRRYEQGAQEDAAEEAFNALTDEGKAAERRRQAAALQAQADQDLAKAKQLAYTDLEAANELADEAIERADLARQYLTDAKNFDESAARAKDSQSVDTGGQIVNLDPTEAASIAFNEYAQRYDAGLAAQSGGKVLEFNQYNTSPEYLSEADIYRRTNNQLEFAGARLGVPA